MSAAASDFREAIERRDVDGMLATLADDVVLHSRFRSSPSRAARRWAQLFEILLRSFEELPLQRRSAGRGRSTP